MDAVAAAVAKAGVGLRVPAAVAEGAAAAGCLHTPLGVCAAAAVGRRGWHREGGEPPCRSGRIWRGGPPYRHRQRRCRRRTGRVRAPPVGPLPQGPGGGCWIDGRLTMADPPRGSGRPARGAAGGSGGCRERPAVATARCRCEGGLAVGARGGGHRGDRGGR